MHKKNIKLRALEPEDINILYKLENDSDLWIASETLVPFSHFQLRQHIECMNNDIYENKGLRLMIDINIDGIDKTGGIIDLFDFDPFHNRAGVGIIVNKQYQNMGVASTALDILINYCFTHLGIHQLYSSIIENNIASIKLFEKKGFQQVGIKKEWRKVANEYVDEYLYQLINK